MSKQRPISENWIAPALRRPEQVIGLRRFVYVVVALLFLLLGLLGVLLPGLPTTPFLLLMSYFLVRSWPSLYDRILEWPVVGKPLKDWREKQGVSPQTKSTAYIMVTLVVAWTLVSEAVPTSLKAMTIILSTLGIYVVWRLPTVKS